MSIWKKIFYAALFVLIAADVLMVVAGGAHGHFWFENLPAAGAVYGFIFCVLIIVISKFIGHVWLMKNEDYYD